MRTIALWFWAHLRVLMGSSWTATQNCPQIGWQPRGIFWPLMAMM